MQDAVKHRIAQVDVAGSHVDSGAQNARAVGKFARAHAAEQVEILFHAALAKRAVAPWLRQGAAAGTHFLLRLVVDIGLAGADEDLRPFVKPLEIVGGVIQVRPPVEAEPAHIALDGVDIFLFLPGRIGIVEAQVAAPAEFGGDAEIEADRLGVPDMQIAVGFRREAGDHIAVPARLQIGGDDVADEIAAWTLGRARLDR